MTKLPQQTNFNKLYCDLIDKCIIDIFYYEREIYKNHSVEINESKINRLTKICRYLMKRQTILNSNFKKFYYEKS